MNYTVEVYKSDKRTKAGERLVEKIDLELVNEKTALAQAKKEYKGKGYRFSAHKTYVTRTNIMTGKEFEERYDTPYYCSPRSETYFSM